MTFSNAVTSDASTVAPAATSAPAATTTSSNSDDAELTIGSTTSAAAVPEVAVAMLEGKVTLAKVVIPEAVRPGLSTTGLLAFPLACVCALVDVPVLPVPVAA